MLIDKLLTVNSTSFPMDVGTNMWERTSPVLDNFIPDNPDNNPFAFENSEKFGATVCNNDHYVFCSTPNGGKIFALNKNNGTLAYTINYYGLGVSGSVGWSGYCGSLASGTIAASGSMACTNDYLVVGSTNYFQLKYAKSGIAHVFNANTGQLIFTLNNPNPTGTYAEDYFGHSVAINDNYIIVGSPMEDWGSLNGGAFYVFSLTNGSLVYSKGSYNLTGSGGSTQAYDGAGFKVVCNSTLVAVSAPEEDYGFSNAGVVYIYNLATGNLVHTIYNPRHDNSTDYSQSTFFGSVMSMSESYLLVGCPNANTIQSSDMGVAYLFDLDSGLLLRTFNSPNISNRGPDRFGRAVAVNETYSIISNQLDADYINTSEFIYRRHIDIYDNITGFLVKRIIQPNYTIIYYNSLYEELSGTITKIGIDQYEGFGCCLSVFNNVFCTGDPMVTHKGVDFSGLIYAFRI